MTVVSPTVRPKSVRIRVIEVFGGVFVWSIGFRIFFWYRGIVIGLSQISFFFFVLFVLCSTDMVVHDYACIHKLKRTLLNKSHSILIINAFNAFLSIFLSSSLSLSLFLLYTFCIFLPLFKWVSNVHIQDTHTIQRLMLSKDAKLTIFYHITVILQYCWDKTVARSGDMYRGDSGILTLVIKCFGITNTSVQNFTFRISSVQTVPKCLRKLKGFFF